MPNNNPKPLILVDGSSYLFRAFHAIRNLSNSRGEPTNAIYGVINMVRKLIKDYQPEMMAVIFDAKGKTFRNDLYSDYKANRPPMPDELRSQIKPIHEIIRAMGIPLLVIDGVEADDVIGTLCQQAGDHKIDTVVSTGDKDMAQLVNEHITLINTMTDTLLTSEGVEEKFGVPPQLIIDYLALVGDTSDNIPGVPSCGPKTAVKWLKEFGSIDEVMRNADKVGGKVGEKLRQSLEFLPLSKQLTTIKCDVELPLRPADLKLSPPNTETLRKLFQELEFKTWLKQIGGEKTDDSSTENSNSGPQATETIKGDYEIILNDADFKRWLKQLEQADLITFDTETTSLDYMIAEIVGVSFAVEAGKAAYVPLTHDYEDAPQQLDRDQILQQLKPLLEDPGKAKLGQNLKYDMHILANHGIKLAGIQFDTMLESYVFNSTATRHNMDSLALSYLSHETIHFEDIAGKGVKQLTFNQIPIEQAGPYAAEDADITLRLHQYLWPQLQHQQKLAKVFTDIEIPLVPILSRIERNGVLVDEKMLQQQSQQLEVRMAEIASQIFEEAGEEFNISSPKQIQAILYDKLELPILKKTPKGQPSTAEPVLQELALDYPLPKLILEYRSLSKLKSTYTDKLPGQINPATGRVHTSYHQAVTATGRLSSSDPNLQNIPIRSAEGRRIRQAFIAPPGYKILAADYSQIELRIMAHLSEDKGLLKAFKEDKDVHSATASEIFGVPLDQVEPHQRRSAKAVNFGLIYGMSAFGLAKQLGVERYQAQEYIDLYFERYPGVKAYMDRMRAEAHEQGYVETLFGRRLYLADIRASNAQRRQYAERAAINAPMQGTAADIIKLAMINCDKWLTDSNIDAKTIMQVHDELVFEIKEEYVDEARTQIERHMSQATELAVPLVVDIGVGNNWDEAH